MSKITRSDVYARDERGGSWFEDFLESFAQEKEAYTQEIMNAIHNKKSQSVQGIVDQYREMVGLDSVANTDDDESEGTVVRASMFEKVYKNSPKTLELKEKIEDFGDRLSHWNLERDEFPDVDKWVDENMKDFPYGQDEVKSYLGDVMTRRSQIYWNTSLDSRMYPDKKRLLGILSDLAGDEGKSSENKPLSTRHANLEKQKNVVDIIENDPELKNDIVSLCRHSGGNKSIHSIIDRIREKLGRDLVSYSDSSLIDYINKIKEDFKEPRNKDNSDIGMVGTESEESPEDNAADYITHGKGI